MSPAGWMIAVWAGVLLFGLLTLAAIELVERHDERKAGE